MSILHKDKELLFKQKIDIKAEIKDVWDALINPEMTRQYMFGCEPVSDWNIGSNLNWIGAADGVIYVKGQIVKFKPFKELSYTTFAPHSSYDDIPSNYLTGTFVLTYSNGETTVNIEQGDFSAVENGQKRYEEAVGAWEMSLNIFKKVLEEKNNQ